MDRAIVAQAQEPEFGSQTRVKAGHGGLCVTPVLGMGGGGSGGGGGGSQLGLDLHSHLMAEPGLRYSLSTLSSCFSNKTTSLLIRWAFSSVAFTLRAGR